MSDANMNERTQWYVDRLTIAGEIVPSVEECDQFIAAAERNDAVGPIMYPGPYRQGMRRLDALKKLSRAAKAFRRAHEELVEASREEQDPKVDAAMLRHLKALEQ